VFDASGVGLVANKTTHYDYSTHGNLTQSTTSGTDVDTVITHTEYAPPNTSGKWLVGLPARTWTESGGTTLTESLNLYDGANTYNTMPTTGILTATRTLIDLALNRYSQTSMTRDDWGNVISQTTWSGYGTQSSAPASGARTTYTCFGGLRNNQVENLGGTLCQDDGYHTYALWMKDALGHKTTVNYSANAVPGASATGYTMGLPVSETDPNNATTSVTYDVFGRFTGLTKPGDTSPTLNVSYVNNPFKVTLTQTIDASQTFVAVRNYDGLGRQTSTVTNGVTVTSTFNAYGKPLTQSMPHASGAWYYTTTDYDSLGRPVTVTAPDTTTVNYAYDGLTNTVTDANNHSTTTVTDILGRTLSITPPATIDNSTPPVTFTYDALGNMLTATRGGATMTLTYDNAGRKKTMSDPDLGFWQYSYNALGGMTRQEDAKNQVSCLYYDELNRQRGKDYFTNSAACPSDPGSGYDVTYNYDSMADGNNGRGRRTSMTDASGSTRWIYDARGRVTKETKIISGTSFVTEWTLYNSADLPVTMKYPDGEFVTTTYDNNMLPKTTIGNATYVSNTNYDSAGRMTSRVLGNGLTQAYHYYEWDEKVNNIGQGGRLETLVTGSLQNLAYVYDKVGNIAQMTNSVAGETSAYGYDELDRLTSWALNGTTESYDYDDTGNLIDKNGLLLDYPDAEGSTPTHPHAVTSANASVYAYDNNGNQTTHTFGSDHFDLTYDAENRLVEVQKNDATIALFTYDGDGKRVKSVMDGETILFAGSHYEQKGSTITKYYFAGASRIAMRKYTIPQNMLVEYFLGDHLGSTSITADANGAMVSEMRYKPWGAVRYSRTDPDLNTTPTYELPKYTFTGQFSYVTEFGLMYYGARFYDVSTGRFVSADTIVPTGTQGTQAWDRYAFVNNNPVRYTDPTGHFSWPYPAGNVLTLNFALVLR
jgi:RHS repeat-associated protein